MLKRPSKSTCESRAHQLQLLRSLGFNWLSMAQDSTPEVQVPPGVTSRGADLDLRLRQFDVGWTPSTST